MKKISELKSLISNKLTDATKKIINKVATDLKEGKKFLRYENRVAIFKKLRTIGMWIFALFGLGTLAIVSLHQLGYLDVPGAIDERNKDFEKFADDKAQFALFKNETILCKLDTLSLYETRYSEMKHNYRNGKYSKDSVTASLKAAELYVNESLKQKLTECEKNPTSIKPDPDLYAWMNAGEWKTLEHAFAEDKDVINKVANETGVPARMIVAVMSGEQMRFFTSARESFKAFYEPFKKFGNLNKYSYGIAGMKPDTARKIEDNLKLRESKWYLGQSFENKFDFPRRIDQPREDAIIKRLTSEDHYYAYLYVALLIKQVEAQWDKAGFPIKNRPEVLATIYNLGIGRSKPKANPEAGGTVIQVDGKSYTFGGIAFQVYYAPVLLQEFPLE